MALCSCAVDVEECKAGLHDRTASEPHGHADTAYYTPAVCFPLLTVSLHSCEAGFGTSNSHVSMVKPEEDLCPICWGSPQALHLLSCGHSFCGQCIIKVSVLLCGAMMCWAGHAPLHIKCSECVPFPYTYMHTPPCTAACFPLLP